MCDTLAQIDAEGAWFAKSSDRPPGEVQLVSSWPPRPAGAGPLRTQYLDLGSDPGAHALIVASQPVWLWGLEHGVNEHRVAIGNETVYTTDDPRSAPSALLGMDLVRLTLERARDADDARATLVALLEQHGQGGSAWEHADEPYFSSFLIVDPRAAWVVETSARSWVARRIDHGGVAISNRLTLAEDWDLASADVAAGTDWQARRDPATPTGIADHRLAVTAACASGPSPLDLATIVATLRDHGPTRPALPTRVGSDFAGVSVCMHVRGYQATTASLVSRLPSDPASPTRHWVAVGSPCVSVYVPAVGDGAAIVAPELGQRATWQRFAALRDQVESDPTDARRTEIRAVLDPVEAELWARPVDDLDPATVFAPVASALSRLGV